MLPSSSKIRHEVVLYLVFLHAAAVHADGNAAARQKHAHNNNGNKSLDDFLDNFLNVEAVEVAVGTGVRGIFRVRAIRLLLGAGVAVSAAAGGRLLAPLVAAAVTTVSALALTFAIGIAIFARLVPHRALRTLLGFVITV